MHLQRDAVEGACTPQAQHFVLISTTRTLVVVLSFSFSSHVHASQADSLHQRRCGKKSRHSASIATSTDIGHIISTSSATWASYSTPETPRGSGPPSSSLLPSSQSGSASTTATGHGHSSTGVPSTPDQPGESCFPALGFQTPEDVPQDTVGWWCDPATEYAFLGFSYEITACQSVEELKKDFADIRETYNGRYVRLYGLCDDDPHYYHKVVDAAWETGLGVHALVWFDFDIDDAWEARRDNLFADLHSKPKARFVTRVVQFGSEPLFDGVIKHDALAHQVKLAQKSLSSLGIPVTVSEMRYGYEERGGAQDVLDAIDSINIHMLPFFSKEATTSAKAWPIVRSDLRWFADHGKGKKMYMDENGWPWKTGPSVQPNGPNAVANKKNQKDYYDLLDEHCQDFKAFVGGGVGWFAHIYSDAQESEYGILDANKEPKFKFSPRTHC